MSVKPKAGDLIEIFRPMYQHWAIYVGDGYVIHLVPPSEEMNAGANSVMSVFCEMAVVKKEKLLLVVGTDKYKVNNLLDDKYEPREVSEILKHAHSLVDQKKTYNLATANCEHFVTDLRYGKPTSRQVRQVASAAALGVLGVVGVVGVVAVTVALFSDSEKEKRNKY